MELTIQERRLVEMAANMAADGLNDVLLDTCADQEYRICLLELGIN